jgi:KDO2-lipid IV(A) lauroyltransferase
MQRKWIYRFSAIGLASLAVCAFVPVEDFYFDRGTLTVFAKTLWVLLLAGAMLDRDDMKSYPYRKKGFLKKYVRHPAEAAAAYALYMVFKVLPAGAASALGGALGRLVGKFQGGYNGLIEANLGIAFPKMPKRERDKVRRGMWSMIGRYCAEPEHFGYMLCNRSRFLELEGDGVLDRLKGKPFIAFFAHSGSMGLISIPFALHGAPCSIIYRYPSNNLTNSLVTKSFGRGIGHLSFIPNAGNGTKEAMRVLARGGAIVVVPDQKFHSGLATKFFGEKVRSPGGAARLAAHFNCPILPIQLVRLKGLRHRIIFHEPFMPFASGNREADAVRTTQKINNIVEKWIRENPEQWFWVHDRWNIRRGLKEQE